MTKRLLITAPLVLAIVGMTVAQDASRSVSMKEERKKAAHHRRRIIMNNDGNDCRCERPEAAKMREVFLSRRTSPLVASHVDAIFYCTGVVNSYTHHSKETEARGHGDRFAKDWAYELGNHGPDSLAIMVDFGRKNGMEVFWSMRMNDTHDSADGALLTEWKTSHPEYLMAKKGDKLKAGGRRWSALDYGLPEVREKVFRILKDVCSRYDIDGIEMDFFRHPIYFKPQIHGEPVTQEHCDMMTGLLRRIRGMTEEIGAKRGRPLLIAARVPDSIGYDKGIGLDVEQWLKEDLVDLLVVSGYFHLTPWEESVKLGHQHGVPVYACLSESRIKGGAERERCSPEAYRARALTAWRAGVDGIYTFNAFNPKLTMWRELGDPAVLAKLDRVYFACYRAPRQAGSWLLGGERFNQLPSLSPEQPIKMAPSETREIELWAGGGRSPDETEGASARLTLNLHIDELAQPDAVSVALNGKALGDGRLSNGFVAFDVGPNCFTEGKSTVTITLNAAADKPAVLKDLFLWVRHRESSSK
ncbi:MAG: family 10 glycosylhydrolase [Planctomycetota bacterium]